MLTTYLSKRSFCTALSFALAAFTAMYGDPAYPSPRPANYSYPYQNSQPPASQPQDMDRYEGREEIAYADRNEDRTLYERNLRLGDWDYKENWRYDKEAFYGGETQSQAYDEEHPGLRGIGYDATDPYTRRNRNYAGATYNRYNSRNNYGSYPQGQNNYYYNANTTSAAYPSSYYNRTGYDASPYNNNYSINRAYPSSSYNAAGYAPYNAAYPSSTTQTFDSGMNASYTNPGYNTYQQQPYYSR